MLLIIVNYFILSITPGLLKTIIFLQGFLLDVDVVGSEYILEKPDMVNSLKRYRDFLCLIFLDDANVRLNRDQAYEFEHADEFFYVARYDMLGMEVIQTMTPKSNHEVGQTIKNLHSKMKTILDHQPEIKIGRRVQFGPLRAEMTHGIIKGQVEIEFIHSDEQQIISANEITKKPTKTWVSYVPISEEDAKNKLPDLVNLYTQLPDGKFKKLDPSEEGTFVKLAEEGNLFEKVIVVKTIVIVISMCTMQYKYL